MKRVLDLRPQARLDALDALAQPAELIVGQGPAHARAQRHVPGDRPRLVFRSPVDALVAGIAEHDRLLPLQQAVRLGHVVDVGRRGEHRVHQPRVEVDADVRLHAEVPLLALPGLMHVGVARPVAVLGRRWGGDQGRVHDRALAQQQALTRQVIADRRENHPAEIVCFDQAAELQQRGRIRRRLARQIDADEAADGVAVVQRILDALVRQPEALLGDIHAQHAREPQRRPAGALAGRVERRQRRLQVRPRRHRLQLRQEALAPRLLLLAGVLEVGKARLHDVCSPPLRARPHCLRAGAAPGQQAGINQHFLRETLINPPIALRRAHRRAIPGEKRASGGSRVAFSGGLGRCSAPEPALRAHAGCPAPATASRPAPGWPARTGSRPARCSWRAPDSASCGTGTGS